MRVKVAKALRRKVESMALPVARKMGYTPEQTARVINHMTNKLKERYKADKDKRQPIRHLSLKQTKRLKEKKNARERATEDLGT